jgi:hypothetical protein
MKLRDHLGNLKRVMSQKTILIPSDFKRNQANYNDMRLSLSSKKLTNHGIKVMFNFFNFLAFVESVASKFDPSIEQEN